MATRHGLEEGLYTAEERTLRMPRTYMSASTFKTGLPNVRKQSERKRHSTCAEIGVRLEKAKTSGSRPKYGTICDSAYPIS